MNIDEKVKGNVRIDMDSDGDFHVDVDGVNKNTDWVADNEDGSSVYSLSLDNFIGDPVSLKCKINELFYYFRSPKTSIMKELCGVFEKLEANCVSKDFQPEVYFDYGNQSYEAHFDLKPSNETDAIKLEIKNLEHRKAYYESQINDYQKIVSDCNDAIENLKSKLVGVI